MQVTVKHLPCLRLDCRWGPDENRGHYTLYTGCPLPLYTINPYSSPILLPGSYGLIVEASATKAMTALVY
jgi:hypothetical protein